MTQDQFDFIRRLRELRKLEGDIRTTLSELTGDLEADADADRWRSIQRVCPGVTLEVLIALTRERFSRLGLASRPA